tara:strand:+ start:6326 stop:6517 length:192 start_codon:yes stop_codon:yes gene_type:complete
MSYSGRSQSYDVYAAIKEVLPNATSYRISDLEGASDVERFHTLAKKQGIGRAVIEMVKNNPAY